MICILVDAIRYPHALPLIEELLQYKDVLCICHEKEYKSIKQTQSLLSHERLQYKVIPSCPKFLQWFQEKWVQKNSLLFRWVMASKYTSLGQILYEHYFLFLFHFNYVVARKVFQMHSIESLVIVIDRDITNIGFVKRAQELKIPIIQPYYHNPIASYVICQNNKKYMLDASVSIYQKKVFDKFAKRKYGEQVNNGYFFYPAFLMNAWHKFGMLPNNMWIGGSGAANYVFADNGVMEHNLVQYIGAQKVRLTGTYELDTLFRFFCNKSFIAKDLKKKYDVDSKSCLAVFSAIPNAEHSVLDKQSAFNEFESIVQIVSGTLKDATLLIALHPKMYENQEVYRKIADSYKAVIVEEKLIEVISAADIYIASASSSTLFWGVLCGIKSISLDLWNLKNDLFASSTSVQKVYNYLELQEALCFLHTKTISFEDDWKKLKREESFDGNSLKRQAEYILSSAKV